MNEFSSAEVFRCRRNETRILKHHLTICGILCTVSVVATYIFSLVFSNLFLSKNIYDTYGNFSQDYCIRYLLFTGILSITNILIPFLFATRSLGGNVDRFYPLHRVKPSYAFGTVFLGLSVCMGLQYFSSIWSNALSLFGYSNTQNIPYCRDIFVVLLLFIALAVIPALTEEFVYRGAILHALKPYGDGFAVVVSAALFGMGHIDPVTAPFAFLTGLVLGFVTVKSNSILPCVLIHLLNNLYALLCEIISVEGSALASFAAESIIPLILIIVGIIAFVLFVKKYKSFFLLKHGNSILSTKEKVLTIFSNVGILIFIVLFFALVTVSIIA